MGFLDERTVLLDILDEAVEHLALLERRDVAREDELLARPCERHVEFAVDDAPILGKRVGGEELELVALLNGERIDNDIALRPLVALHGVDADVLQLGMPNFSISLRIMAIWLR